jgi:NADH dehydrogenase FAD-containing subunit
VPGRKEVFTLGDCACPEGGELPQLAQVAEQQGNYLGEVLNRRAAGRDSRPFVWRNVRISLLLGGGRAIVEAPGEGWKYAGAWAYQHWRSALFTQVVSPRNKVPVPLDRLRAYAFGRDLSKF